MDFKTKFKQAAELPGKFLSFGGHAQQDIPSQHRLLNAGGMVAGWWALDHVRDIVFGYNQKTEGEYVEIKREDVPAPLRFLHKTVNWDPNSDAPSEQWKKLAFQMLPGIGGGIGAVAGSIYAFQRNGRAQTFKELKGLEKLNMFDGDFVAQMGHSTPLRVLAGIAATFSSASGLTFLYGFFLNGAFASANGAKIFTGKFAKGNMAPHKLADSMLGNFHKTAMEAEHLKPGWAQQFRDKVLEPMIGHEITTPEHEAFVAKAITEAVEKGHDVYRTAEKLAVSKGLAPAVEGKALDPERAKILKQTVSTMKNEISDAMVSRFKDPLLGNANPAIRAPIDGFAKAVRGITGSQSYQDMVVNGKQASASRTPGGAS